MAAVKYTKGEWSAEADIQPIDNGKYQGIVLISHGSGAANRQSEHAVEALSNTPREALDEAKALAHRLLSDL